MLVPLELDILVKRLGYLSPRLALGWRIGCYLREFFLDLVDVRIAAKTEGDAALGLSMMFRKIAFPLLVTISNRKRTWDFHAYHYLTGTALQFTAVSEKVELPAAIQQLENYFEEADQLVAKKAVNLYRRAMDELIVQILNNPVESYCSIKESRIRLLGNQENEKQEEFHCHRCGCFLSGEKLLDVDGIISCVSCADLEEAWFQWV